MPFDSSLCVYCASGIGIDSRHGDAARELGRAMALKRIRLVYGGARIGIMGALADAVLGAGGEVVGIIPGHLDKVEVGHRGASELLVVGSMHERKHLMFEMSDAFAVLPGGFGTLDETFEILTWRKLGLHDKPVMLVDIAGRPSQVSVERSSGDPALDESAVSAVRASQLRPYAEGGTAQAVWVIVPIRFVLQ